MGLFANLPVGLAPGLGLNGYVSHAHIRYLTFFRIENELSVRICCRRFPRKWHHHLPRGSSRRVPRGVSRILFLTLLRIGLFFSPFSKMGFFFPILDWSSTMACAYHASVISARCRRGNWTFHCVSSDRSSFQPCHANHHSCM